MNITSLVDSGILPDPLIRAGIRRQLRERLRSEREGGPDAVSERFRAFLTGLARSPIAVSTASANEQHYEVPAEFYKLCLGRNLKYSSGLFVPGVRSLDQAEEAMLALYESRAGLADGQEVLELGCGWGSLTLWIAAKYPRSNITGVSNSSSQREYIIAQAARRGLANIRIITCDINTFDPSAQAVRPADRVVSVEMFEHMKNWPELFRRVASWMKRDARFFMHIFTHRDVAYHFTPTGDDDWMACHFFTGGMMPSDDLPLHINHHLRVADHWRVSGEHYGKTSEAWLANLDDHRDRAIETFSRVYGSRDAERWINRWRVFFMACDELWNFKGGSEWIVSHYLMERADHASSEKLPSSHTEKACRSD